MSDSLQYNSVIRSAKTPKQKRSVATKQKIMDAALSLFALHGYDNTSINMITQKAGAALGSFYSHFKNKEEIFLITLENHILKLADFTYRLIDDISAADLPLDESIDKLISELSEENKQYLRLNHERKNLLLTNKQLRELYIDIEKKMADRLKDFFLKFTDQIHEHDWDSFTIIVMHMVFITYTRLFIDDKNIDSARGLEELKRTVRYMIIK